MTNEPIQLELFPDPVLQAWIDWAEAAGVPVKIYVPTYKTEDLMGFLTPMDKGPFATPRRLNVTLSCTDCDEDNDFDGELTTTWQQWQCCACGQWHDWKEGQYEALYQEYKATEKVGEPTQPSNEVEQVVEHMFKERNGEVWDLRDEDGDLHSPVWYLEAWMSSQLAYAEALTVHHDDPDKDELHMQRLDDMQTEVDMYARYVNKLFGYSGE